MKRRLTAAAVLLLALGGCGIDAYNYLPPPVTSSSTSSNDSATITLRDYDNNSSFTSFRIYYRIYVSDLLDAAPNSDYSSAKLTTINSQLSSDYYAFSPYIDSDTLVNTNIGSLFSGRGYYPLELENLENKQGNDIENKLLEGHSVIFDFMTGKNPTLTETGAAGSGSPLYRSTGGGVFTPQPNRYFVNTSELNATANINSTTNADVVDKANISGARFTYVALYIVAVGIDENFSPVYSTPAFIGILKLPEG